MRMKRFFPVILLVVVMITTGCNLFGGPSVPEDPSVLFSDNFTRDGIGTKPAKWREWHAGSAVVEVIRDTDLASGRALRVKDNLGNGDYTVLDGATWKPTDASKIVFEYKLKWRSEEHTSEL